MVLLVTDAYPSATRLYANMFVHQRVLGYKAQGLSVEVYVCRGGESGDSAYAFDGVDVTVGSSAGLCRRLQAGEYDKVLIHFLSDDMMEALDRSGTRNPMIVWVHGHEAMSWLRRWFFFDPMSLLKRKSSPVQAQPVAGAPVRKGIGYYWRKLKAQAGHLRRLRHFIERNRDRMEFVFVSAWIKSIVESDVKVSFDPDRAYIIHNPIDIGNYAYSPKDPEQRLRLLSIRSFSNRKYANDITMKAIRLLSRRPYFHKLEISISGDGPLFDRTTASVRKFPNVTLEKRFFNAAEMSVLFQEYGVFLCPTRMDTQGVSMCEAMSSGMVCISSENSAIPEFLPDSAGFRTKSPRDIVKAIDYLMENPDKYVILSTSAAGFIREKCSMQQMNRLEMDLITKQ